MPRSMLIVSVQFYNAVPFSGLSSGDIYYSWYFAFLYTMYMISLRCVLISSRQLKHFLSLQSCFSEMLLIETLNPSFQTCSLQKDLLHAQLNALTGCNTVQLSPTPNHRMYWHHPLSREEHGGSQLKSLRAALSARQHGTCHSVLKSTTSPYVLHYPSCSALAPLHL